MTSAERDDHNLIDGKRRKRIARGSGTSVQEVNQVLKQYADMRRMLKQYGNIAKGKMRGIGKFAEHQEKPRTSVLARRNRGLNGLLRRIARTGRGSLKSS